MCGKWKQVHFGSHFNTHCMFGGAGDRDGNGDDDSNDDDSHDHCGGGDGGAGDGGAGDDGDGGGGGGSHCLVYLSMQAYQGVHSPAQVPQSYVDPYT